MSTKQRGSGWSIKLVFNLYKLFGYKFIYFLMYPVTFFYFIFASNVYSSLKIYYKHLNIPFTKRLYFSHLFMFAICMVDRFISKFSPKSYSFEYENKEELEQTLSNSTVLLLSHFGGWAASSNKIHISSKINIVMKESMLESIKHIENNIENNLPININIIDLNKGGIVSSLEIATALRNEEIVAMMADRANDKKYNSYLPFFNTLAGFNKNPFQIAYKLKKPMLVIFSINIGIQQYKVINFKIPLDASLKEEEAVLQAMQYYVSILENILKQYPTQWFNFYNFWEKE